MNDTYRRVDIGAGLVASTVVIPKAMACAVIAGMPVQSGLYTALAAMMVYPFLGTARVLSVTTTSTIALMTAAVIAAAGTEHSPVAVGTTLALLVGGCLFLARCARLGFIANFISKPVLVGFEAGIGIVIAVSQLKSMLGVHITSRSTLGIVWEIFGALPRSHAPTMIIAVTGITLLLILPRVLPWVSAPLVLVLTGAAAVPLLGLDKTGVALVGNVPAGLPPFVMPDFSLINQLWPAALGVALMSFTESVASARTFQRNDDPGVNPDRELTAIGAANIASALFGGFPAGGGASQTAVNAKAGARTQRAQFITAGVVCACLLFLSPAIGLLPQAALGAMIFVVALSMVKPGHFRAIGRIRTDELWWAFVTMAGVIVLGTLEGILIAVAISVLMLLYQANHPPVYAVAHNPDKQIFRRLGENTQDVTYPGLLILRTESRITFANAARVADKMRALIEESNPRVIVLECSAILDIEYTALTMLIEARNKMRDRGVELWLAALNPEVFKMVQRSPLKDIVDQGHSFFNLHKVIEAYKTKEGTDAV